MQKKLTKFLHVFRLIGISLDLSRDYLNRFYTRDNISLESTSIKRSERTLCISGLRRASLSTRLPFTLDVACIRGCLYRYSDGDRQRR